MRVWDEAPSGRPGAEPLFRGTRGRSPPEAETFLAFGRSLRAANLPTLKKSKTQKNQMQFVLSLQKK